MRRVKVALVLLVVAALALAWRTGVLRQFADPASVKVTLLALGPWGYVAFVLAYATLQPFGVPGTVFIWAAPLIWPWPVAFGLSLTGTMAASVVGFSFTRFVARDWVTPRIPERFRKYDQALERRAFATVFTLRLIFWMPPLLHAFFGVSRVRFATHFWGSLVGYLIPLFLVSFFGQRLVDALRVISPGQRVAVGVGVAAIALAAWVVRRMRSANQATPETGVTSPPRQGISHQGDRANSPANGGSGRTSASPPAATRTGTPSRPV